MIRGADSWWVWCGEGRPPRPPARAERLLGTVQGAEGRAFAAFDHEQPAAHGGLQFAARDKVAVAFAGWLVNRSDVERAIPRADAPPKSDAEVVLRRFVDAGPDALSELRGQFAVAVWDGDRDTLICQRDPMGIHSLFWAQSGTSFYLSDSLTTLLACDGVPGDLSRVALADALRDFWPDPEETVYTALRRVPAGHRLTDRRGQRSVLRSWIVPAGSQTGWATDDEVEEFDDRFATAVARCMQLGPVGIFLSGGLDSVSVAAFAAERAEATGSPPPVALSLRFPDPGVNEEDVQRSVAHQLGFPSVMMGLDEAVAPHGVIGAALRLSAEWPSPMLGPWLPAYLSLGMEGRKRGCTGGILTGHGGDEWLTVSPFFAADLMATWDLRGVYRLALAARRSLTMPRWRIVHSYFWRFGARAVLTRRLLAGVAPGLLTWRNRQKFLRSTPAWLAPDPELRREIDARYLPPERVSKFYDHELAISLNHTLVSAELEEWHEAGRRIGAPIVSPFLDVDLIELLYRIHPDVLNRDGRSKGLVRSTVDRRFPDLAFGRQKKVQAFPTLERLLVTEGPHLARLDRSSPLVSMGVVDPELYESAGRDALAHGNLRQRWALFHVQSVESFARAHC